MAARTRTILVAEYWDPHWDEVLATIVRTVKTLHDAICLFKFSFC